MIESKEFVVENFLTNSKNFLKMRYLLGFMFEVSFNQAQKIEDKNLMKNRRWIVYSWDIKIDSPIKARDKIEISTFAIDMNKFYAYRNFLVKRDGEIIAKAYCVFLLFDISKMRPIKIPKTLSESYKKQEAIYVEKKQKYGKEFFEKKKIYIRKNDIDSNFHVNNAAYMDIIREISKIDDEDISYINIVYKNEIRNKDYIYGQISKDQKEETFRLVDDNEKIYSLGKIVKRNV